MDGLRGVAVLLVLVAHANVPHMKGGGNTGVTLFFVLSGFLIATLVLEEGERTGRISFRRFYERRARRLLPAALVTVGAVALIGLAVDDFVHPGTGWGTVLYFNNWVQAGFDGGAPMPAALNHAWSLSIEEQFYVLAPVLILMLRTRPGALLGVCALGAVAVLCHRMAALTGGPGDGFDFSRVYYSTDMRADALLIGVALAAALARFGRREISWLTTIVPWGLVALAVLTPKYSIATLGIFPFLIALAAVPVILNALDSTWLSARWLRWVGRRSYGVYLFHYPLVVLLLRAGASWPVMLIVTGAGSLGLAALSWRWIEQPILRRGCPAVAFPSLGERASVSPSRAYP